MYGHSIAHLIPEYITIPFREPQGVYTDLTKSHLVQQFNNNTAFNNIQQFIKFKA